MSKVVLNDIAPEIYENSTELTITAPMVGGEVLIDGDFIATHILQKFRNFAFDYDFLFASDEIGEFLRLYKTYSRVRAYDFYRLWQALHAEYNPIENYNSIEINKHGEIIASGTSTTTTDGETTTENENTQTGSINNSNPQMTVTDTYPEITTTHKQGTTVSTQERTTYDNTTFNDVEKNTTQQDTADTTKEAGHTDTHTTSYTADTVTTYNNLKNESGGTTTVDNTTETTTEYNTVTKTIDTDTTSFNTYAENKLTRSGNIGVTTSQQMIESEIALRMKSVIIQFIDVVINSFCYLSLDYESGGDKNIIWY